MPKLPTPHWATLIFAVIFVLIVIMVYDKMKKR